MSILPEVTNLFHGGGGDRELIDELLQTGRAKLERIVSNGQASEPGFWYDQGDDEWCVLVRGRACLEFEGGDVLRLSEGNALVIPAHCKHRVASVSQDAVWIALHYADLDV